MIKLSPGATLTSFKYPCGELQVRVDRSSFAYLSVETIDVEYIFDGSDSVMELLQVVDVINRSNEMVLGHLTMDYVPFSRQDREANVGDSFSLKVFCDLVNEMRFERVFVKDVHSLVTLAMLDRVSETTQEDIFAPMISQMEGDFYLVAPDGGALRKTNALAQRVHPVGVIVCAKTRNTVTGEITGTEVYVPKEKTGLPVSLCSTKCIIVDDICDGGRTFVEIAKELRLHGCSCIVLCVTHGFFTKGLEVFDGLIDEIYTKDGRVK